jgi:hypothetical protein
LLPQSSLLLCCGRDKRGGAGPDLSTACQGFALANKLKSIIPDDNEHPPANEQWIRERRVLQGALLILVGVGLAFIIAEAAVRIRGFEKPEFYA